MENINFPQNKLKSKNANIIPLLAKYGIFVVFGLVIVFFSVSSKYFFTFDNIFLILQQASPLGIGVVGMTFVLIISGIDISVGRNGFFVSTVIAYFLATSKLLSSSLFESGLGYIYVYAISIIIGMFIGLLNALFITKVKITPFIVTLATGYIIRGFGLMISDSASPNISAIGKLSNGSIGPIPYVLIIFVVVAIVFDFILRRTSFGRHLMAIGNSPESAKKAGIKIDRSTIYGYVICGGLGSLGGLLSAGQIGSVPLSFGEGNEFIMISAAVLGGTSLFGGKGNIIPGALVGIILTSMPAHSRRLKNELKTTVLYNKDGV